MSQKYDDLSREELVRLLAARDKFMELAAKFWFLIWISKAVPGIGIPFVTMPETSEPFEKKCFAWT